MALFMFGGNRGKRSDQPYSVVGVMSCLVNLSSLSCLPHSTLAPGIERIGCEAF